jgi:hypothetical protein
MKTTVKAIKTVAFASMLGFLAFGSANSYADITSNLLSDHLSGIVPPSLPAFVEGVNVSYSKINSSTRALKATYASDLGVSSLVYTNKVFGISNTTYSLTANFNNSNVFQNGTVSISGKITGLGINTTQTLMTANLTKFATGYGGYVLGFNTSNIVCNPLINAYSQCTTAESIYIGIFKSFNFKTDFSTKGYALTSVPIPAAAWLFGSGLLGLVGIARRKKKTSV